ncbi:hypothetical protein CKO42_15780 [Lamprobacter modestohalophilus]|uniref:N,N-dimethylformamidase beta subunit-like C-terminal domain-containing protein n=2 Tax=Lamprobacter modestohalophilus TaxID=1064514 RepID=A0A9X1B5H9_9GAMM|nr:hypothetical protein [Lamprobacter modestohalophilus]
MISRRSVACLLLAIAMMHGVDPTLAAAADCNPVANPVAIENTKAGTRDWQLSNPANDIDKQIKGFASLTSVAPNETLDFHVSVTPAQDYRIEIYRLGWYGGSGGRLLFKRDSLSGDTQPDAIQDPTTGLVSMPWEVSYSLTIPPNWVSGVYAAKLINAQGFDNYVIFVVRDDRRAASLLFQRSVTTDQAYNNYPDDGAIGKSLYNYNSHGGETIGGSPRAVKVSFDRPYTGRGAGSFFDWEYSLLRWIERQGYDVSYNTNLDTHRNGSMLLSHNAFLSTGHDEYWTKEMRDAVEAARDSGVHLAFFGANAAYWQSRLEPSDDGTPDRVLTVYKNWQIDPIADPARKTVLWRQIAGRAEQQLLGVQYLTYGDWDENTDYVVQNSKHWLYAGTGFVDGDRVPGIVGYEVDSFQSAFPAPVGTDHTFLSASEYLDAYGDRVTSQASIYQAPSGAWVFASGTMCWSWALDNTGLIDARLQQTTANLLDAFNGGRCEPTTPAPDDREGQVYEDAEDGETTGWRVYAGTGAIENLADAARGSRVIALQGNGMQTGYQLRSEDGSPWQDAEHTQLVLDLRYSEPFRLYVNVETNDGQRYLEYSPVGIGNDWTWDIYIHHGLSASLTNGQWQRIERDLVADLKAAEPQLELLQVNGVLIRGSGRLDDITLAGEASSTPPSPDDREGQVYEDAEDGETAGWRVYAGTGAIKNLADAVRGSRVIALQGNGMQTGYQLRSEDGSPWQDAEHTQLVLDLRYSEPFRLYVNVETNDGQRYLEYSPVGIGNDWTWDIYIHHGLSASLTNGQWQRIERDLVADLKAAEPPLELRQVNGVLIRGSGRLDDIELR